MEIVTVNYFLTGKGITNTEIDGDLTLLDADIVLCNPAEFKQLWSDDVKRGNDNIPYMYSPNSDRIRSTMNSRKKEIESLLDNGKVIISFLEPLSGFKAEINNRSDYDLITNYDFLPLQQDYFLKRLIAGTSSSINSLKLNKGRSLFEQYFSAFRDTINYTAYLDIDGEGNKDYFILNKAKRPVAAVHHVSNGLIVLLPPIPYVKDNQKLIGVLRKCSKAFLSDHVKTPPPAWIKGYKLKGENELDEKTEKLQQQIEALQSQKITVEKEKIEISQFKGLLYEQGPELESVVLKAFQLIGFKAENRKHDDIEHDVVFESEEGRGIAEIEGKDNDAVHISKLDQLNRAVDEDFDLTNNYPQGVLIGNHYRLTNPDSRKDAFTEKVHIVAQKKSFGLLTTEELYKMVASIFETPKDDSLKRKYRKLILTTVGKEIKITVPNKK